MKENVNFSELIGKTLMHVSGCSIGSESIILKTDRGERYELYHSQDCCESVSVSDIEGDINDLIGNPLLQAEESTNSDSFNGKPENPESFTWTFYKLATIKGYVTIRWLGESNGYYSESVDFIKCK